MEAMEGWVALLLLMYHTQQWQTVATRGQDSIKSHIFYAVEMEGGSPAARALAKQHGLQFISKIGNLEDHYTFKDIVGSRSRQSLEAKLYMGSGVKWVKRQRAHYRDKRAAIPSLDDRTRHELGERQREIPSEIYNVINSEEGLEDPLVFNDPYWPMQWELYNRGQFGSPKRFDLNIMPVWKRNITGKGVVVTIIDDGVDHTNVDLKTNFELYASFDLRGAHGLSHDPMPLRDSNNGHGTRCAGEVAMEANNSFCGVGIAYNARIGGIRLLDGAVTDSMEATSLTYNNDFIDIYSCCWGPRDNGKEMAGPGKLTEKALRIGAQKGRKGKGSIFVWASGNGGLVDDHCGADGYVNSIYTIAIGAITHSGLPAYFGEPCPAVMAVTLTGATNEGSLPLVTATNVDEGCVTHFTGTSSAAPIAAGILALVLEAKPNLTWRDVQHLIANTAKIPNPVEPGWKINGGGYHLHERYGFGLLDAGLMVQQALEFETVRPQRICSEDVFLNPVRILSPGGVVSVHIQAEACRGTENAINVLEHIQSVVSITSVCRGDLSIDLISPFGTKSRLLGTRHNDMSGAGLKNWTLMSVHSWGEDPRGIWKLKVTDNKDTVIRCFRSEFELAAGAVLSIKTIFYGTFDPKKELRDNDHQKLVSMGDTYQFNMDSKSDYSQQDIIEEQFENENLNRVNANDIPVLLMRKKTNPKGYPKLIRTFKPQDMDDTNGSRLRPHLQRLWNTLRDNIETHWTQYKALTRKKTPQLRWMDLVLVRYLAAEPKLRSVTDSLPAFLQLQSGPGSSVRARLLSRPQLLRALSADLRKMQALRRVSKSHELLRKEIAEK
uniref:PC3-like endoprotease variant B n=1 Tax=Lepisosteus oculatus TaxID=7918 RepID=W5NKH4_LEPOC|nr:PREDICTED: PC3-like endoprotease variant B isoform X1 [Lepisosteus oculatus]